MKARGSRRDVPNAPGRRIRIVLTCSVCGTRNYQTTKSPLLGGSLNLKKHCSHCNQHTVHIESK